VATINTPAKEICRREAVEALSLQDDWSLSGATLRVTFIQFYKNWFVVGKTKAGDLVYDGSDYRLVEMLRKKLNFTIKVLYAEAGLQPGTVDRNGTWNGIVGELHMLFFSLKTSAIR
jgi:hypothetical protein